MPELPDVEGFRRTFNRHAAGKRFGAAERHGKLLICPAELEQLRGRLGPDWLSVSRKELDRLLAGRRASLKATLMNQSVAAGLGNLTADEALWRARLDPRRHASSLEAGERAALYRSIRKVLRDSLPYGLVPSKRGWMTGARGGGERACPRCGARLERRTIGGRTTYFCPAEQR